MASLRIAPTQVERKFLTESDERYGTEGTYIDVRHASIGENEQRFKLFKTITEKTTPDGVKSVDYEIRIYELMWLEFEQVLAGCNIQNADGSPLIEFDGNGRVKDPKKMVDELRSLQDHRLLSEMHKLVLEVNSHWQLSGANPVGE